MKSKATIDDAQCPKCKANVDAVYFDGYAFGDRLLEGVMFKLTKEGEVYFKDDPATDAYVQQLNTEYWLTAAVDWIEDNDIADCVYCQGEILLNGYSKEYTDEVD